MSAFTPSDIVVPKNFHEIAGLRLREIGKVPAEPELIKQSRRARAVRIPPSPHAFSVMLIANDQLVQSCEVELQLSAIAQFLDGFNEN